jgi:hypothetical protein
MINECLYSWTLGLEKIITRVVLSLVWASQCSDCALTAFTVQSRYPNYETNFPPQ